MRKADPKHFKNIIVDESNILNWKGLIVPVCIVERCSVAREMVVFIKNQ